MLDFRAYLGFWPYWGVPYADESGEGLLRLMDRHSVEVAVVTPLKAALYDAGQGNELLFAALARHADRLLPAPVVNPRVESDPGARVAALVERGARALVLFPFYHGYRLRPDYTPLAKAVEAAGRLGCPMVIPLRLLMNWGFPTLPVQAVLEVVAHFPDTNFVVGGFNYGEVTELLEGCRRMTNLWLETSGLTMMCGVENIVEQIGPDRIVCGTAMPLQYPGCGLVKVRHAFLPEAVKEQILRGNAESLLGRCEH